MLYFDDSIIVFLSSKYFPVVFFRLRDVARNVYVFAILSGVSADLLFKEFPEVGLDKLEIKVLYRSWLRQQLEAKRFLPQGADIYQMAEGWDKPTGIDISNPTHCVPNQFQDYLIHILDSQTETPHITWNKEQDIQPVTFNVTEAEYEMLQSIVEQLNTDKKIDLFNYGLYERFCVNGRISDNMDSAD